MDKQNVVEHTVEYYSAMKRNEVLVRATIWMKLENVMLSEGSQIQKESCTKMFIAALFTIARTWKQPKCPSLDEWIKKMWYTYTMEY